MKNDNQKPIIGAILIAGFLIAGAILLKGNSTSTSQNNNGIPVTTTTLSPVGALDRTLGNQKAKITVIMYTDFQCPFCAAVSGLLPSDSSLVQYLKQRDPNWAPSASEIINNYVKNGTVLFVYRDWAFLGPESIKAGEAARCAGDQGKFWEYHDYLFANQGEENKGAFSNPNLESFAKILGLETTTFNQCLESGKYTQAMADSKTEGATAGVNSTPQGFILKDGKIVGIINGAESFSTVKIKIDAALK